MKPLTSTNVAIAGALLAVVTFTGVAGTLRAQQPGRGPAAAPKPDNPQSLAHIDAAKKVAGDDPWLLSPYTFYCVAGNARGNNAAGT